MMASEHDYWTSHVVRETDAPTRWGDLQDGHIRLLDVGVDAWPHALVSPNTFWFFFPRVPCPDRPWECALIRHIQRACMCRDSSLEVHLFTTHSHVVESYGIWTAVALQEIDSVRSLLTLHRQIAHPRVPPLPIRQPPFHVRVYEHYLRCTLPNGWTLCREECDGPSVVDGRRVSHGDTLRGDLFLTKGCCKRVIIVCFPARFHVVPQQSSRCMHLRDRVFCRVLAMFGTPPDIVWLDFGCPGGEGEPQRHTSLDWICQLDE